jgi:hypothetical protein
LLFVVELAEALLLVPELEGIRVARKLFHAAIVALEATTVLVVEPEPTKMSGAATTTSCDVPVRFAFSPPMASDDAFVTSPVWFDPKMNSRASTNAYRDASATATNKRRTRTDSSGVRLWYEMSGAVDEHVGPVSLLVHDAGELAVVRRPFGRRLARKALDSAKRRVLNDHWDTPSVFDKARETVRLPSELQCATRESSLPE